MFEPHAKRGIILDAKVAKDVEPTLSPLSGVYQMFSCHRISYIFIQDLHRRLSLPMGLTRTNGFPWIPAYPCMSHMTQ
jgi:hypothetical protein